MMKYLKNNKGFTLVEVIVVAVIVLILAAVAIPLYQGYMRDSRISVATSTAQSIASAISAGVQARGLPHFEAADQHDWVHFDNAEGVKVESHRNESDEDAVFIVVPTGYTALYHSNGCVRVEWDTDAAGTFGMAAYARGADCEPTP